MHRLDLSWRKRLGLWLFFLSSKFLYKPVCPNSIIIAQVFSQAFIPSQFSLVIGTIQWSRLSNQENLIEPFGLATCLRAVVATDLLKLEYFLVNVTQKAFFWVDSGKHFTGAVFSGTFERKIIFENGLIDSIQSFNILEVSFLDGMFGLSNLFYLFFIFFFKGFLFLLKFFTGTFLLKWILL